MHVRASFRSFLYAICLMASLIFAVLAPVSPVLAQTTATQGIDTGLQVAQQTGLSGTDPRVIIARVIQSALGFLGVVALVLVLYGGYLWMTAGGNEVQVDSAKTLLRNALIGL